MIEEEWVTYMDDPHEGRKYIVLEPAPGFTKDPRLAFVNTREEAEFVVQFATMLGIRQGCGAAVTAMPARAVRLADAIDHFSSAQN